MNSLYARIYITLREMLSTLCL